MICPKCRKDKPEGMVYYVNWSCRMTREKFSLSTKEFSNLAVSKRIPGYVGLICHDCNKGIEKIRE